MVKTTGGHLQGVLRFGPEILSPKLEVFDQKKFFLKLLVGLVWESCMQVRKTFLEITNSGKRGALQKHLPHETQNTISVSPPCLKSNSQQTENKLIWRLSPKQFQKPTLRRLFSEE